MHMRIVVQAASLGMHYGCLADLALELFIGTCKVPECANSTL